MAINYNLRSAQNSNNTDFNTANYDVRTNQQFAHNTISQAHLPFILPSTQQPQLITPKNSAQQMDNPINEKTNTTTGSASPKKTFSMTNYLSTPPKQPTIGTTPENEEQLPKPPDNIFNTKLIAAMTNRDTVLREVLHPNRGRTTMQEAQQTNPRQVEESKRTKRLCTTRQQTCHPQQPQRIGPRCFTLHASGSLGHDRVRTTHIVALH